MMKKKVRAAIEIITEYRLLNGFLNNLAESSCRLEKWQKKIGKQDGMYVYAKKSQDFVGNNEISGDITEV